VPPPFADPSSSDRVVADVTCLGCGCACDDIRVTVHDGRIVEAENACALGVAWFGDGTAPASARVGDRTVSIDEALDAAAAVLSAARRPLIYLAPGLTCEAQRESAALADLLGGLIDSITSDTALGAILAAQERGRASATLGEARHRADVVVWWGVDPARAYPRYAERYAPMPPGQHVPEGRASRTVVAVDVGDWRGPADADRRFALPVEDEIATLTAVRALVGSVVSPAAPPAPVVNDPIAAAIWARARALVSALAQGRYVLIVAEGERRSDLSPAADQARLSGLIALAQTLNGPTRAALSLLRAGGNRQGADAVLTAHTGYPVAVDFARGFPRYRPYDGTAAVMASRADVDALVVIGRGGDVPALELLPPSIPVVHIGPAASAAGRARVGIDTGLAGVHEHGTALRLDDVPLPVRAVVPGPPPTAPVVKRLTDAVVTRRQSRNAWK
jgi:formylmethanofuran dehydrogenase subunit B